jgi:hypothetical protein
MKKIGFMIFILALGCKGRSLSLQKEEKSPPESKRDTKPPEEEFTLDLEGLDCKNLEGRNFDWYGWINGDKKDPNIYKEFLKTSEKIFLGKLIKARYGYVRNEKSCKVLGTRLFFKVLFPVLNARKGELVKISELRLFSSLEDNIPLTKGCKIGIRRGFFTPWQWEVAFEIGDIGILFLTSYESIWLIKHESMLVGETHTSKFPLWLKIEGERIIGRSQDIIWIFPPTRGQDYRCILKELIEIKEAKRG